MGHKEVSQGGEKKTIPKEKKTQFTWWVCKQKKTGLTTGGWGARGKVVKTWGGSGWGRKCEKGEIEHGFMGETGKPRTKVKKNRGGGDCQAPQDNQRN